MTVYASSNIDTVTVSGAGHSHARGKSEKVMEVNCAFCEPELLTMGWVRDSRNVELTFDERRDAEIAQEDSARFEQIKVAESAREAAAAVRAAGRTTARTTKATRGTTR